MFFLSLSAVVFLCGEKLGAFGWAFLSGGLCGLATLTRQPCALNLVIMAVCLVYGWLIPRTQSTSRVLWAGSGLALGFLAPIATLAFHYRTQGNLADAYHWAFTFALRYVESDTTLGYVLGRLVTVHLFIALCWAVLWYFGLRQAIAEWQSSRRGALSMGSLFLLLWLGTAYLSIFIGWRFP